MSARKVIRYRAFSLTWPASMQIYWNKRKRLHKKRVQLPKDWFGTPTWPLFHCLGTPIWPPWRHVKTLFVNTALINLVVQFTSRKIWLSLTRTSLYRNALLSQPCPLCLLWTYCFGSQSANSWTRVVRSESELHRGVLCGVRYSQMDAVQFGAKHQMQAATIHLKQQIPPQIFCL